jgi:glycosyltransferase involved in cell wall biosynthesis
MSAARPQIEHRPIVAGSPQPAVLHVPFTWFPDAVGGTEIHVAALIGALQARGIGGAVAAPGIQDQAYAHQGVPVYRLATDPRPDLAQAYGAPDRRVAQSFAALLERLRPRPQIVHLHARTAAVSQALLDAARMAGAKIVFTYHTPTVSCARGTMMRMGGSACDGRLDRRRCGACTLAAHGMPPPLRDIVAHTPEAIGRFIGRAGIAGRASAALRLPGLIGMAHRGFYELVRKTDRIVAVCLWARDMLRLNGVPDQKLVLCRQGLPRPGDARPAAHRPVASDAAPPGILRLGYFGRLDPAKGIDTLMDALRRIPEAPLRLDIFAVRQAGSDSYASRLERRTAGDHRIVFRAALPPDAVREAMQRCDIVAVPSRVLETGPLVVLEAFDAGVPVLGARLGGVAELVSDGIDGVLVPPERPAEWAAAILDLANRPAEIARLRAGIRPPRTIDAVADEMAELYRSLASPGGSI